MSWNGSQPALLHARQQIYTLSVCHKPRALTCTAAAAAAADVARRECEAIKPRCDAVHSQLARRTD